MDKNPFLSAPKHPNYLRRARHHDYRRPARYMITLSRNPELPPLSAIAGNPHEPSPLTSFPLITQDRPLEQSAIRGNWNYRYSTYSILDASSHIPDCRNIPEAYSEYPHVVLKPAGKIAVTAISEWAALYPQIAVTAYVIMPDHIHLAIHVHTDLEVGLSRAISRYMGIATRLYRNAVISDDTSTQTSFFSRGFNDRIAYDDTQQQRQWHYICDNPRRYLIKKFFPRLFHTRWQLSANGKEYIALGNIFLLRTPHRMAVKVSRRHTPAEKSALIEAWHRCAVNGGTLISPFIHPKEKEIYRQAVETGASIIKIMDNGFSERFAPSGQEFELCSAGRLLLIAPSGHQTQAVSMTYAYAQSLNALASHIAVTDLTGTLRPCR